MRGTLAGAFAGHVTAVAVAALLALGASPAAARDGKAMTPVAGDVASIGRDAISEAPLQILVSLSDQKVEVYRGTRLVETTRISSGKAGYGT
ncbi:unnamed protein product, partial [Scytosiphon promiscuus]